MGAQIFTANQILLTKNNPLTDISQITDKPGILNTPYDANVRAGDYYFNFGDEESESEVDINSIKI